VVDAVRPAERLLVDRPVNEQRNGKNAGMSDDDDWVGTPPEGHITRDRADPQFWYRQKPVTITGTLLLIAIVILVVVLVV
jgi:hypothetical protein